MSVGKEPSVAATEFLLQFATELGCKRIFNRRKDGKLFFDFNFRKVKSEHALNVMFSLLEGMDFRRAQPIFLELLGMSQKYRT